MNNEQVNLTAEQDQAFDKKVNFLGRWTSVLALLGMFAVPSVITLVYGLKVDWATAASLALSLIALFAPMAIVENISYYTVIGAGAVYLSCITGNIMNMKLPCALSGMKIAEVEPGSKKGDIISILSVGVSSMVTTIILFLSMLIIGQFLVPYLSHPILKPGFDNIMPALMGAVAVPFMIKSPKLAVAPLILALGLYLGFGAAFYSSNQSYLLLAIMVFSVVVAYFMHKSGVLNKK